MPVYTITEHGEETATVDTTDGAFAYEYTGDNTFVEAVLQDTAGVTELYGEENEEGLVGTVEVETDLPVEEKIARLERSLSAVPGVEMEQTGDREMARQKVPPNAISINDPSEAPQGAEVIRGPRGGVYYIPGGADAQDAGEDATEQATPGEDRPDTYPNPEADIERFMTTGSWADEHIERMNNEGDWGFTANANLTEYDGGGYVVTITNDTLSKAEGGLSKEDVTDFYERMLPVLENFPEIAKVGGWSAEEGDDYMSVDLNIVLQDEEAAVALGEAMNQKAIFNMDTFESVPTGGDGTPVVDGPEDAVEAIGDVLEGRLEALIHAHTRKLQEDMATDTPVDAPFGTPPEQQVSYVTDAGDRIPGLRVYLRLRSGRYDLLDSKEGVLLVRDAQSGQDVTLRKEE
jgi:hypothetical protein